MARTCLDSDYLLVLTPSSFSHPTTHPEALSVLPLPLLPPFLPHPLTMKLRQLLAQLLHPLLLRSREEEPEHLRLEVPSLLLGRKGRSELLPLILGPVGHHPLHSHRPLSLHLHIPPDERTRRRQPLLLLLSLLRLAGNLLV